MVKGLITSLKRKRENIFNIGSMFLLIAVLVFASASPAFAQVYGDFNNDGFDDLTIGVPQEAIGTILDAGAVHILYGSAAGLQATGVGGPNDQLWHQDSTGVADT